MFPITDPSRAADIRMRRRRAVWLLLGTVVVPLVLVSGRSSHSGGQSGESSDFHIALPSFTISSDDANQIHVALQQIPDMARLAWMVQGAPLPDGRRDASALSATGHKLAIDLPCAQSIAVVPKSDLGDRIYASTLDGSPVQEAGLELRGGDQDGGRVTLGGTCRHGGTDVVVQASPSTALFLTLNGGTSLRTGGFSGPVRLVQRGGGDAVIDAARGLDVEKSGGGSLVVGHVDDGLHLVLRGGGDATINGGHIDHAEISLDGDGDLHFGPDAHIGALSLVMHGGGDVAISHLDGSAGIEAAGSGDVAIADIGAGDVHLSSAGSGDISIASGSIGRLEAEMRGSGDLAVQAVIGDAHVRAGSASDISLPHVRGRLDRSTSDE
ncbi:GIN domain-containing protein [Lichenicoccus sp.]|uniref:GIN domain-containing protein n=1 Tax=Lichenicoccus sp. TaxID=2781899 RepID=UPI003D10AD4D